MYSVHLSRLAPQQNSGTWAKAQSTCTLWWWAPESPPNINTVTHTELWNSVKVGSLFNYCIPKIKNCNWPLSPLRPPDRALCSCDKRQGWLSKLWLHFEPQLHWLWPLRDTRSPLAVFLFSFFKFTHLKLNILSRLLIHEGLFNSLLFKIMILLHFPTLLLTICSSKCCWDGHTLQTVLLAQHFDPVEGAFLQASQLVLHWVSWQGHGHCHIRSCGNKSIPLSRKHLFISHYVSVATLTLRGLVADDEAVYFP